MKVLAAIFALVLLAFILVDAFVTIVLARRTERTFRFTRVFYKLTWAPYAAVARRIRSGTAREEFLSIYGPLSLLVLIGAWAAGLVLAFGLLQWVAGLQTRNPAPGIWNAIYFSGTTLFTVGSSQPENPASKLLMVAEAGLGLSMLGLVVGYLPVLYQSYSSRELRIFLLDSRAGSPPSACELLRRQTDPSTLAAELASWEQWVAELLQHHLSYPMLSYFRAQHVNQSWLAGLVMLLDATAILTLCSEGELRRQAGFTFAMSRHALADLGRIFGKNMDRLADRLPEAQFERLRNALRAAETAFDAGRLSQPELKKLRERYEPYANALSNYFLIALPPWMPAAERQENWSASDWENSKEPFAVSDPFLDNSRD